MAKVNLVQKKVLVGHGEIIKYQLLTYCFIDGVQLSMSELNCLTLLAYNGEIGLSEFCTEAVDKKIFKTSQTVRNFLNKASKKGLIFVPREAEYYYVSWKKDEKGRRYLYMPHFFSGGIIICVEPEDIEFLGFN